LATIPAVGMQSIFLKKRKNRRSKAEGKLMVPLLSVLAEQNKESAMQRRGGLVVPASRVSLTIK